MSDPKASGSTVARSVRALDVDTWPAFARLAEANNGVWGGCWCVGFHAKVGRGAHRRRTGPTRSSASRRVEPTPRWCSTATSAWAGASSAPPRSCRRSRAVAGTRRTSPPCPTGVSRAFSPARACGVADAALGGALAEIARHGGGTVEGYPEETDDRTLSGSFLHTGPMAAFENHGFTRTQPISPHRWVVTRTVDPA